jgi:hypothetical protein
LRHGGEHCPEQVDLQVPLDRFGVEVDERPDRLDGAGRRDETRERDEGRSGSEEVVQRLRISDVHPSRHRLPAGPTDLLRHRVCCVLVAVETDEDIVPSCSDPFHDGRADAA